MKKQFNFKTITLLAIMLVFCSMSAFAQKEEKKKVKKEEITVEVEVDDSKVKKKVVIVQKIKDKDGKVKIKRVEKEGDEATKYLNEMELKDSDGKVIDIDIKIEGDDLKLDGANVEIIEIDDLDDLSDEIKKKLEALDLDINILDDEYEIIELEGNDKRIKIIEMDGDNSFFQLDSHDDHLMIMPKEGSEDHIQTIDIKKDNDKTIVDVKVDGKKKTFSWEGEMPADVKKEMEALGLEVKEDMPTRLSIRGGEKKIWKHKDDKVMRFESKDGKVIHFKGDGDNVIHLEGKDGNAVFVGKGKHLMLTPTKKIEDKVGNININVSDDKYTLEFDLDKKEYNYEWEGDIPEKTKKELTEMGFDVKMVEGNGKGHGAWIRKMEDHNTNKAFLGVMIENDDLGVKVTEVYKESAAEAAGLKEGDIITAIAGTSVKDVEELVNALKDKEVGNKVEVSYIRGESTSKTTATLKERKESNVFIMDSDDMDFDFDFDEKSFEDMDKKMKFKFKEGGDHNFFVHEDKVILGIYPEDSEDENGVKISGAVKDSGADKAGLKKGDVITSVDGKDIKKAGDIGKALDGKKEGDVVNIKYTRDGKAESTTVHLTKSKATKIRVETIGKTSNRHKTRKVIIIRKKKDGEEEEEEEVIIRKSGDANDLDEPKIKVFPNPTSGRITIKFTGDDAPATVSVKDVSGKEIFKEEIKDFGGNYEKQVNVSDAAAGLLIVTISQGDEVYAIKVLKN